MIIMMTERPIPARFDPSDEAQLRRRGRIAVNSMANRAARRIDPGPGRVRPAVRFVDTPPPASKSGASSRRSAG
jgi:hypothetical protein